MMSLIGLHHVAMRHQCLLVNIEANSHEVNHLGICDLSIFLGRRPLPSSWGSCQLSMQACLLEQLSQHLLLG